jgi:hypothetical protein
MRFGVRGPDHPYPGMYSVLLAVASETDCIGPAFEAHHVKNKGRSLFAGWRYPLKKETPGQRPGEAQCWWLAFPESDYFQADIVFRFGNRGGALGVRWLESFREGALSTENLGDDAEHNGCHLWSNRRCILRRRTDPSRLEGKTHPA